MTVENLSWNKSFELAVDACRQNHNKCSSLSFKSSLTVVCFCKCGEPHTNVSKLFCPGINWVSSSSWQYFLGSVFRRQEKIFRTIQWICNHNLLCCFAFCCIAYRLWFLFGKLRDGLLEKQWQTAWFVEILSECSGRRDPGILSIKEKSIPTPLWC